MKTKLFLIILLLIITNTACVIHEDSLSPETSNGRIHIGVEKKPSFEIEVDGAVRYACFPSNLGDLRIVEAFLGKDFYGSLDDLVVFSSVFFFDSHTRTLG